LLPCENQDHETRPCLLNSMSPANIFQFACSCILIPVNLCGCVVYLYFLCFFSLFSLISYPYFSNWTKGSNIVSVYLSRFLFAFTMLNFHLPFIFQVITFQPSSITMSFGQRFWNLSPELEQSLFCLKSHLSSLWWQFVFKVFFFSLC
jgi:hypothetical protein